MSKKIGFDNDLYLKEQTNAILERVNMFGNKLYLEFGGKLLFDYHAVRVLPGFKPNVKMEHKKKLKGNKDKKNLEKLKTLGYIWWENFKESEKNEVIYGRKISVCRAENS